MLITEMIAALEAIKALEGDVPVYTYDGARFSTDAVVAVEFVVDMDNRSSKEKFDGVLIQ